MVQTKVLGLVTLALSSYGSPDMEGQSLENLQENTEQWVKEIQLSGTFRLGGKGFASLITPRGNFWVEEGKFSSGYKLIELDTSQSQPSALIQKGDQQAWIGFRTGIVPRTREVRTGDLRMRGGLYYARGDKEPFNGKQITPRSDGSKWLEMPYVNGKRHGKKIWFDDDGRIWSETPYVDGRRQGVAIKYYKDGTKKSEEPWADGIRVGSGIEYRENGMIAKEVEYADSVQSEVWYREDGSKWKEMPYKGHVLHGTAVSYHKDGSIKEETPWVNGKINGMQIGYREDGSKAMETLYENGKEISRKEF